MQHNPFNQVSQGHIKVFGQRFEHLDQPFLQFLLMDTPEQDVVDLLQSVTGIDFGGVDALNEIGERIFTLERLFNLKVGLSAKDGTLPKRFLKEPMPEGPSKGQVFEQDKILPEYYRIRGWNQQGILSKKKLEELGLSFQLS